MKIKNLLFLVPMLVMSLCLVSCGDDDDDDLNNGNSNGDNTEIKGDYTATTSIKTATLTSSEVYGNPVTGIRIYEDFNNLYTLVLSGGNICFAHYPRYNGEWNNKYATQGKNGIKDIGKVTSLQDVDIKNNEKENDNYYSDYYGGHCYSQVQPSHGYAAYLMTENDEVKYIRIFLKDYKLDDEGSLASITIQYQLY